MSIDVHESPATRLAAIVWRTRRSLVATVLAAGLLLALTTALAWVAGGVVLDLVLPLSVPGRQAVWCGWWAAVAVAIGAFLVAPAMRWPLLDAVALRIERVIGDGHNQLLTVVDLARRRGPTESLLGPDGRVLRPDMVRRLLDQTQERIRGFRPARVLPWRTLVRNLAIAVAVVGCIAMLYAGLGERFVTTLERLLHPTADIPPATWLQLRSPGDIDVLEGEPLEIHGRVIRGAVDAATLVIYDAAGRSSRQPMRADAGGGFVALLDGLDRAVRFRLEAGNTWTKTHTIAVMSRPEIRSVACSVRLPDYMRIDTPLAFDADARRIEAPESATVAFEVTASPDAASGILSLAERSLVREPMERFDDRVWFEDDLPRDAVSDASWRWTTVHAAGGLRSFICGTDEHPLDMRTRLEPLVMPRERPDARGLSLMVRLDPTDVPSRLTLLLEHGQGKTAVVWGAAPTAPPTAGATHVTAGPLPPPGEWVRLVAPMKLLGQLPGQTITGATFAVDRGRALLDRPGWTERSDEVVTRTVDTVVDELPLAISAAGEHAAGAAGGDRRLTATLPVTTPLWVTTECRSAQGHASLPMPPIEIVPTVDGPPSIIVDAMPEALVLKAVDDVALTGRGFDDWGIDEVCVIAGPDPARMEVRQALPGASPSQRPPVNQLSIAATVSAETLGLAAGKSAVWKLRIRDTKGQTTESKLFRVTVLTPPEIELATTQVPALTQARREAEQLARESAKKMAESDANRNTVREALAANTEPAKKLVDELASRLDRERRMAEQLAKAVEKAAEQADRSDLVPQQQKEMLNELREQTRSLEQRLAGTSSEKPDAGTDAQSPAAAATPQDAADKKVAAATPTPPARQAATARAARVADAPTQSDVNQTATAIARQLEGVKQQLDAHGAALQLDALAKDLERRAEKLAGSSSSRDAADDKTSQQVRDVEQILGRKIAVPPPGEEPAAAAPPRTSDSARTTPAASDSATRDAGVKSESNTAAEPAAPAAPQSAAAEPRDKPSSANTTATNTVAEKTDAPGRPAEHRQPAAEPQSKTPAAAPLPAAAAAAAAAAAETSASTARLAARLAVPAPKRAMKQPESQAEDDTQDAEPQSLSGLLDTEEVRRGLEMAERSRRLQAREAARAEAAARAAAATARARPIRGSEEPTSNDSGSSTSMPTADASAADGPSEGGAMTATTAIRSDESLRGLDAAQRAALYKLPPHIRDPLLEGMRQRGPAAYQGVIDTYFRQLGKDIPQ